MNSLSKSITIKGNYYDTFIYKGYLFLITLDKDFISLDWNKLVIGKMPYKNHLGYHCAFMNSNYLYEKHFQKMFGDEKIKEVIKTRFEEIENIINIENIAELKTKKDSSVDYLPNDIDVHDNYIYFGNSYGLHRAKLNFFTSREKKLKSSLSWGGTLFDKTGVISLDITQKYGNINLSTLDNGLYEFSLYRFKRQYEECFSMLSNSHSSFSTSNGISVLNGSNYEQSKFVERIWEEYKNNNGEKDVRPVIAKEHSLEELFGDSGYFISAEDKIYLLNTRGIHVIRYGNRNKINECFIANKSNKIIEIIDTNHICVSDIICASVEFFGIVIEYRNKIQVLLSTGRIFEKKFDEQNKFVNWRTFPRSIDYTNQLHLIFEDRIEIHSFNDDYFVNQEEKTLGSMAYKKIYRRKKPAI